MGKHKVDKELKLVDNWPEANKAFDKYIQEGMNKVIIKVLSGVKKDEDIKDNGST